MSPKNPKTRSLPERRRGKFTSAGRRRYLVAAVGMAVLMVLGIGGYAVFRLIDRPKTLEGVVFDRVTEWYSEADEMRSQLEDLLEAAGRAVSEGDESELVKLSGEADDLGRELSKLRVRISRGAVPEDEDLNVLKDQSTQVVSYIVEAVENVQVLPEVPPDLRRDLVSQAHRFLVLADTSRAWIDAQWQSAYSLGEHKIRSKRPLVDDSAMAEWLWTPDFADGVPKEIEPWDLDGVPAAEAESKARSDVFTWAEAETMAAQQSEITAAISAACAGLEAFARADTNEVEETVLRRSFEANRSFSNAVAPAAAPADAVLSYTAAWRGTRGYHESLMTGIVADGLGDLRIRWLFKTYRLAILAGASWNQGLRIAERARIPFGYVPSCIGRLEIVFLSPWDVRQDLTSVIPGPRAGG